MVASSECEALARLKIDLKRYCKQHIRVVYLWKSAENHTIQPKNGLNKTNPVSFSSVDYGWMTNLCCWANASHPNCDNQ